MTNQDRLALGLDHGMPGAEWGNCADYAMLQSTWRDAREIPTEAQIQAWYDEWEGNAIGSTARKTKRAAMAAQWAALPAWITGHFGHLFERASACLDDHRDEEAAAIIQYAEPPSAYSEEQRATFIQVRDAFAESLASLGS